MSGRIGNQRFMLGYIPRESPAHRLTGATKLVVFLLWSALAMAGYDTRVMAVQAALGIVIFALARIRLGEIAFILRLLVVFMLLNLLTIYLFAPEQGVAIYGSRHVLLAGPPGPAARFTLTAEQLFYEANVFLKYAAMFPVAIVLIVTTHPSEFAASLNRVGVPYTVAYAVSLTFRYIPDVRRDFETISQAQQARGLELSKKQHLLKRIKGSAAILFPLILNSMERIDTVSRAMELRSFGKNKKRTWYNAKPFKKADFAALAVSVILFAAAMVFTFADGERFYNPFRG